MWGRELQEESETRCGESRTCVGLRETGSGYGPGWSQPFTTKEDLKRRIRTACTKVNPEMLFRVRQSFVKRINKCLYVNRQQFEHLIK
ncbi:hypothetical protein ALC57_03507 [Trachymyrmex cornetzi]|uniref:Uncharacterized protein n=1 Tax=Trachymyrmex cornetzi TaxID=471704 RepID=A0A195EH17_9HYME|nr:hypothetical protein ALC57_03507 [Trachymyrmex cornetzi]